MNGKITNTRSYGSVNRVKDYSDILQDIISAKLNLPALNLMLDMQ